MKEIKRLLFVRTDRIGDALMNLPALRTLRQAFPKSWITAMTGEQVAPLFRGQPDVDEVFVVRMEDLRSVSGLLRKSRELRKARFDAVLVSNPDKRLHLAVFLAGIPVRVGYARKWGFLLTRRLPDKKNRGSHEIDYNLELVKLLTPARWDGRISLAENAVASERVEALYQKGSDERPLIALHPGSSNPGKRWPVHRFVELCRMIRGLPGHRIVLIGGEEEKGPSRALASQAGEELLDWTGRLNLPELSALFAGGRVKALVSSDSGPVHIAWLAGTPVVAMYAKNVPGSDPARWGPRDKKSVCIHKNMADISSEEVFDALKKVLGNNP